MVATTSFDREKMAASAPTGFSLATEIADYLVRKNVPFASAHEAAGKCVALCEKSLRQLHELSDEEFRAVHPSLDGQVRAVLTVAGALSARTTAGGTAPALVIEQIKLATQENQSQSKKIAAKAAAFSEMMGA